MLDGVRQVLTDSPLVAPVDRVYLVRDLLGKVRVTVSEAYEDDEALRIVMRSLVANLQRVLGPHGYGTEDAVLFVDSSMLEVLDEGSREVHPGVYWVDRQVTGSGWATVHESLSGTQAKRYTLYSVKGGVGRSTTAAVLALHLAEKGERVMVVDLDLESPGLSAGLLDSRVQPRFGITDWFVEDLVGMGDHVIEDMTARAWEEEDYDGDVRIVPAHGADPGEYLTKLGRVYLDTDIPWTERLGRLLARLEERYSPSVVLLESRSGLHDIAAATVTDLAAEVLLFAVDTESSWTDYRILFQHWQDHGLAGKIRERLSIISALTPEKGSERYLRGFQERSWNLFRDHLYDEVIPDHSGDHFSYDLEDEEAPHNPIPIYWTLGLAAGASLRDLAGSGVPFAYLDLVSCMDSLIEDRGSAQSGARS